MRKSNEKKANHQLKTRKKAIFMHKIGGAVHIKALFYSKSLFM